MTHAVCEAISQYRPTTFCSHGCCQGGVHVIGQQGSRSVDDPISYHHGHQVAGGAHGVKGHGSIGEVLVSCVCGDPEEQTWSHLQRCQACVCCIKEANQPTGPRKTCLPSNGHV